MAGKKKSKKSSGPVQVGVNDIPEIQCIVCKGKECELFIELKLSTDQFIGIHEKCMIVNV